LHLLPTWSPQRELPGGDDLVGTARGGEPQPYLCKEVSAPVEFAEGCLEERQPFRLKLGEDYEQLERSPP